ncbi:hypothetical protein LINPERPRIM_LOCUS21490 [Linum perenne]
MDLEYNRISTTEEIPPIPEPEFTSLRMDILKLLHPNVVGIDQIKSSPVGSSEQWPVSSNQPWGEELDLQLRLIFLRFFCLNLRWLPQFHRK